MYIMTSDSRSLEISDSFLTVPDELISSVTTLATYYLSVWDPRPRILVFCPWRSGLASRMLPRGCNWVVTFDIFVAYSLHFIVDST